MKTPVKRYVEIFEEKVEGGKSALSYYGYDHKMHNVGMANVMAVVDCMDDDVFPNGVPNFDGKARFNVNLIHDGEVDFTNPAVRTPSPYINRLLPKEGYSFVTDGVNTRIICTVSMSDGEELADITDSAFNPRTGEIRIPKVVGNLTIEISEEESEDPQS